MDDHDGHFSNALANSFLMVVATELGDKTFFIAAVLAMKKSPVDVFAGCWGALALMTVLSGLIGRLFPALLTPVLSHYLAIGLFPFFGLSSLKEAHAQYSAGTGAGASDELEETEKELEELNTDDKSSFGKTFSPRLQLIASIFSMTFMAEWGDKSQVATVALGAARDLLGVLIGAVVGHALCTGAAIAGGKMLSTRISERFVSLFSGVLFLVFAAWAIYGGVEE